MQPRAHAQINPLQATNVTNLQRVNNSVNVCRHKQPYVRRTFNANWRGSTANVILSIVESERCNSSFCSAMQKQITSSNVSKTNNQSYLVVVRVHRLGTTAKAAAAPLRDKQCANCDKKQGTTHAFTRCYNSRQDKSKT
jgi:hypothetical protein